MDGNEVHERCAYRMGSMAANLHEATARFVHLLISLVPHGAKKVLKWICPS